MSHVILQNVYKKYGDVDVIHDVNLQIDKGEFVATAKVKQAQQVLPTVE